MARGLSSSHGVRLVQRLYSKSLRQKGVRPSSLAAFLGPEMQGESKFHEEYGEDMVAVLQLVWGEGFMTPGGVHYIRTTIAGHNLSNKRVLTGAMLMRSTR